MAGPNVSATTSIRNDHTAATRKYHAAMFSDASEVSDCMVYPSVADVNRNVTISQITSVATGDFHECCHPAYAGS